MNAAPTASAAARFRPGTVTEPGEPSKTTYTYDSTGRVARILAPTAPGVTCVDAQGSYTNAIGCRSLRFDYGTTGSATGRLSTVVDPRSGLGPTYGYDSGNRLTSVKTGRADAVPAQLHRRLQAGRRQARPAGGRPGRRHRGTRVLCVQRAGQRNRVA